MRTLRIATRQSALALWQAEHVAARLRALHANLVVELVPMTTRGDQIIDRPLATIGGKGLFLKELEVAMLEQCADIAVHSFKDVPMELESAFAIGAVLERADAADAFISNAYARFNELPRAARVGTSSLRRQAQVRALRPDLELIDLRGNVNTRLAKLDGGQYDAIILACAGIDRLGLGDRIDQRLEPELMAPAPAQGALAVQCRVDDQPLLDLLAQIDDRSVRLAVLAERAVLDSIGATCGSPIGALATQVGSRLHLLAAAVRPDGARSHTVRLEGGATEDDAMRLGAEAGRELAAVVEFPR